MLMAALAPRSCFYTCSSTPKDPHPTQVVGGLSYTKFRQALRTTWLTKSQPTPTAFAVAATLM